MFGSSKKEETFEERRARLRKEGIECACANTFGIATKFGETVDQFYQQAAPKMWRMLEDTNAKTDEILAETRKTNAAVTQFLQQAQGMQDAEYWRGECNGKDEVLREMYKFCDRMSESLVRTNQALQEINKKLGLQDNKGGWHLDRAIPLYYLVQRAKFC